MFIDYESRLTGEHIRDDNALYHGFCNSVHCVVKIVKKSFDFDCGLNEIQSLRKLGEHPYIVKMLNYSLNDKYYFIFLEKISGYNLYYIFEKGITYRTIKKYLYQICEAICYCHCHNVVHRDIKLENIMVDKDDNIKLLDFGYGGIISEYDKKLTQSCGSLQYASPEILNEEVYDGKKSDVYSFGILSYLLLNSHFPYKIYNIDNAYDIVKKSITNRLVYYNKNLSLRTQDFIESLIRFNPKYRPEISLTILHSWFYELHQEKEPYHVDKGFVRSRSYIF